MSGLTFQPVARHMILPKITPPAVPKMNATRPRKMMSSVCGTRKLSALIVMPVPVARKIVTMLQREFCAVSERRSMTPDSRKRLPSMSMPSSEAIGGSSRLMRMAETMGKQMRSNFVTVRICSMTTSRSFCVVRSFMTGGWMSGTSDM